MHELQLVAARQYNVASCTPFLLLFKFRTEEFIIRDNWAASARGSVVNCGKDMAQNTMHNVQVIIICQLKHMISTKAFQK